MYIFNTFSEFYIITVPLFKTKIVLFNINAIVGIERQIIF